MHVTLEIFVNYRLNMLLHLQICKCYTKHVCCKLYVRTRCIKSICWKKKKKEKKKTEKLHLHVRLLWTFFFFFLIFFVFNVFDLLECRVGIFQNQWCSFVRYLFFMLLFSNSFCGSYEAKTKKQKQLWIILLSFKLFS